MTIKEYYDNYDKNKNYNPKLFNSSDLTIDQFYVNCIAKHVSDQTYIDNAIEWHNMLMEYAEEDDAIFWVRYHENGPKNQNTGRYQTRRACRTIFKDGFSYVFVSNYDAHEIFNMVHLGVKPDLAEFKRLMQNHEFPLHYDAGKSCEESDICTYPHIGNVKGGILTPGKWYLAHIIGVKSDIYVDTLNKVPYEVNAEKLYPRGVMSEWCEEKNSVGKNIKVRRIDDTLSQDEKAIIKAHFLRFVDPLNYYIVPGAKYQNNKYSKQIGESEYLNIYMREKYSQLYKTNYKKFEKKALVPSSDEIYITYAPPASKNKNQQSNKPNNGASKPGGITEDKKLEIAADYLRNSISYIELDKKYFNIDNQNGNKSWNILKKLGIRGGQKGLLKNSNIDIEITKANGDLKDTLTKIKAKGL